MKYRHYGLIEEYLLSEKIEKALVIGIGGGGDILATIPTANFLETLGINVILGAVIWERWVVDPEPGPIKMEELINKEEFEETIAFVNKDTYAIRGGRKIIPQVVNVAKTLNKKLIAIDISKGVRSIIRDIERFSRKNKIDLIIGIDGGGDVLAKGGEADLWSPVADQMMLAVLANITSDSILGVFGIGTDGELSIHYLLRRLSEIAKLGGYIGLRGITKKDVAMIEKLMENVVTETNKIAILSAKGEYGQLSIRSGSRIVDLSLGILTPVTIYLNPKIVFETSKMAKAIMNAQDIWRVKEILNEMGIFTEIDLEIGIKEYLEKGLQPDLKQIKNEWYQKRGKIK